MHTVERFLSDQKMYSFSKQLPGFLQFTSEYEAWGSFLPLPLICFTLETFEPVELWALSAKLITFVSVSNFIVHNLCLFQLEDSEYKPLVPEDIRLPPPMPPSERLLAAVEAFYSPPSHERPRDRWCDILLAILLHYFNITYKYKL